MFMGVSWPNATRHVMGDVGVASDDGR